MTGAMIFAYLVMPLVVGAMGTAAYIVFMRYDDARRHAEAKPDRSKG